jgi:Phasin protein
MSTHQRRARNKPAPRFQRKHGGASTSGLILEQGNFMPSTDENKPIGKPGPRNRKGGQRRQKSDPQQSPKPDQLQSLAPDQQPEAREPGRAMVASAGASTIGAVALARSIGAVAPTANSLVSIQTIANAYGDYTNKSLQETRSFVVKLMEVRSLDKALEIQAEFARQAYETFVAESQKICELYSELARQIFKPWEGFAAKVTQATR